MALQCKYRGQSFSLPTSWEDVTLGQVQTILGTTPHQAFEALTNIPASLILEGQPALFTSLIIPALSFIYEPQVTEGIVLEPYIAGTKRIFNLPLLYRVPDVEQETYGQAIDAISLLQEEMSLANRLRLLAIYLQPAIINTEYDTDLLEEAEAEILHFPYLTAMALSDKLAKDIAEVCQAFSHQTEKIPESNEQRMAGIKRVQELGPILTLKALANGDKTKYEYFLKKSWAEINNLLIAENIEAAYQYKLHKLLQPKK